MTPGATIHSIKRGRRSGRDAFKEVVSQFRAAVPDLHCDCLVRTTGTHTGDQLGFPATNKSFETVSANIGRMGDGQAVEHWAQQGMFPMLMQLGVLPPMGG